MQAGAAVLFWVAVLALQKFNWGAGIAKASVLFGLLVATPILVHLAGRWRPVPATATSRPLAIAAAVLLALHIGYALKELRHPSLIDFAATTLAAGEALWSGANPYTAALDPAAIALAGGRFGGYKYLPATILAYLPLGAPLGQRGIVITNLLLELATAWLTFRLAARIAGRRAAWLALVLFLSLPLVPHQLFAKGATDLVAVLPLLAAVPLVERRPGLAGLCLGLSLAAKTLPGALLLPCCLPQERHARLAFAAGIAAGLLPVLPFLLWSPGALFDEILRFNLTRPPDSTSWLFAAPALAAAVARALFVLIYSGIAAYVWWRPPSLLQRSGFAVTLILAAILAAPAAHHNYQLWWLPFGSCVLAVLLAAQRLPIAASSVYESAQS